MIFPSDAGGSTTQHVGLFECAALPLSDWLTQSLGEVEWQSWAPEWTGPDEVLRYLEPSRQLSRYVAVPYCDWTVLLNNSALGTDVGMLPSAAARELRCRAIRAVIASDTSPAPARIVEVYDPRAARPLLLERSVIAAEDGGRWVFETSGTPYPFEDLAAYGNRRKAKRFTSAMAVDYLRALGVPVGQDPAWYRALVIERRAEQAD